MKRYHLYCLVTVLVLALGSGIAFADNGIPRNGNHFNLNIIGVKHEKDAPMTGSNRHTIFVGLGGKDDKATSYIYLKEGEFKVCDGNAFDPAYDCDGNQFGQKNGAVFQLPANGNWELEGNEWVPTGLKYEVYARALGKLDPDLKATMYTCVEEYDGDGVYQDHCSTENVIFQRKVNDNKFADVTRELTTIYADLGDGLQRYSLFDDELLEYFWTYENNGLKLVQLRFYMLDTE